MLDDEALRVYRNEDRRFVAVTRYDDAVGVLRDWSTFSSAKGVEIDASSSGFTERLFLEEDLLFHKQLRGVVHADFSPKVIGDSRTGSGFRSISS